jgi:hypothetical protein
MMRMMTFTPELSSLKRSSRIEEEKIENVAIKKMKLLKQVVVHVCCGSLLLAGRLILRSVHKGVKLRWRRHLHLHHPSISVGTLVHLALEFIGYKLDDKELELARCIS